jgi:hypothetical protein
MTVFGESASTPAAHDGDAVPLLTPSGSIQSLYVCSFEVQNHCADDDPVAGELNRLNFAGLLGLCNPSKGFAQAALQIGLGGVHEEVDFDGMWQPSRRPCRRGDCADSSANCC